ncbi:MAG: molybdopterin-dependent oxidoreductase [Chloroflexi bacterium]|nr:molybdopterin-dependent oxidoreductase [Chloroflexota bacterium]
MNTDVMAASDAQPSAAPRVKRPLKPLADRILIIGLDGATFDVLNPMIVDGMLHGGIAQGVGQALTEQAVYTDDGQLLSGSMMDYAIPTAGIFPAFETDRTVTPSPVNELGVKGAGETGTIAASPAVMNAVIDALSHLGVKHMNMPATSEKVWRAIQDAKETQRAARAAARAGR